MTQQNETWQVMVDKEVYDADTETLKQWIIDGRILPTDKVKKGNLNWNEAGRVPVFRAIFAGESATPQQPTGGLSNNPTTSATSQSSQGKAANGFPQNGLPSVPLQSNIYPPMGNMGGSGNSGQLHAQQFDQPSIMPVHNPAMMVGGNKGVPMMVGCHFHPEQPSSFVCRMCQAAFCQTCPKFVGTSKVPICQLCGDLCQPYEQVKQKAEVNYSRTSDFGWNDFVAAFQYPLNFMGALITGMIAYGFFALAQNIAVFGADIAMIVNLVIIFSCTSLVIRHVSTGNFNHSFMPDFTDFSIKELVVTPVLLTVGISIVTYGPLLLVVSGLFFGWFGKLDPTMMAAKDSMAQSEGLTADDMEELRESRDPKKSEEIMRKLQRQNPTQDLGFRKSESQKGKEAEEKSPQPVVPEYVTKMLQAALMIVILGLLGLAWAVFYYPLALTIAGFTQDFWSVINPLVGLSTAKSMGMVYAKAFLMYVVTLVVWLGITIGIFFFTRSLSIPFFGNVIANSISSMLWFYVSISMSYFLGLALYKCADQLDIAVS